MNDSAYTLGPSSPLRRATKTAAPWIRIRMALESPSGRGPEGAGDHQLPAEETTAGALADGAADVTDNADEDGLGAPVDEGAPFSESHESASTTRAPSIETRTRDMRTRSLRLVVIPTLRVISSERATVRFASRGFVIAPRS